MEILEMMIILGKSQWKMEDAKGTIKITHDKKTKITVKNGNEGLLITKNTMTS